MKRKETKIKAPAKCLVCGAKWAGGSCRPGERMKESYRVFYGCGASMSVKSPLKEYDAISPYHILFKNCCSEETE